MQKPTRSKEQMKLYQRDRRAKLLAAKDVLSKSFHSGITVTKETRDGVDVLKVAAKFNQAQLDALEEVARGEGTDAETMIEDMLQEIMISWRRERGGGAAMTNTDKRYHAIMRGWRSGAWGPTHREYTNPTTGEIKEDAESFSADSFIAGMAMGYMLIRGGNTTDFGEKEIDAILRIAAHSIIPEKGLDLGQYHGFMWKAARTYRQGDSND